MKIPNALRLLMLIGYLSLGACSMIHSAPAESPKWTSLFNGKDLSGFYTYVNLQGKSKDPEGYFKVDDGMIHILGLPVSETKKEFGYLATEKEYSDFHFRVQFKWGQKKFVPRTAQPRDSGVLYLMTGPDKVWPDSIECQVQEKDVGEMIIVGNNLNINVPIKMRGNQRVFDPAGALTSIKSGRIYKTPTADSLTDWNTVEVIVKGNSAVHIVNGTVIMSLPDIRLANGEPLTKGKILLQAEGAEVFYRNPEIRPLGADEKLPAATPVN